MSLLRVASLSVRIFLALGLATSSTVSAADFWVGEEGDPFCTHSTLADAVAAAAANGTEADLIRIAGEHFEAIDEPLIIDLGATGDLEMTGGNLGCMVPDARYPVWFELSGNGRFVVLGSESPTRFLEIFYFYIYSTTGAGPLLEIRENSVVELTGGSDLSIVPRLSQGSASDGALVHVIGPDAVLQVTPSYRSGAGFSNGVTTGDGGAILVENATLELYSAYLSANSAGGRGGAIACRDGGLVFVAGGMIRNNTASIGGGAISADGCEVYLGGWSIFEDNSTDGDGGALLANGGSTVQIGGPELPPGTFDPAVPRLRENQAVRGAAVAAAGAGTQVLIHDVRILDHQGDAAGALLVTGGAEMTVERVRISGNAATAGPALALVEGLGSTLHLESSLVSGQSGAPLVRAADGGAVVAGFLTSVSNSLGGGAAFEATGSGSTVAVYSSLLLDDPVFAPPTAGATIAADCIAALDLADFPASPRAGSYLQLASAGEVLHRPDGSVVTLRTDSPAIDFCDDTFFAPTGPDLELDVRPFDQPPGGSPGLGLFDLGADESRGLFLADHEEGDCSEWSSSSGCP
jgi:predicted outer membrane repeat protein